MEMWKKEMFWLTVLYRMLEAKEQIHLVTSGTDYEFAEEQLKEMSLAGLIETRDDSEYWHVTKRGEEVRNQMLGIYDQVQKFEIFNNVSLALELDDDITDEDGDLNNHCFDPRFDEEISKGKEEELGTEDMRIAMMTFLSAEFVKSGELTDVLDPHRVVFMQMLAEGEFKKKDTFLSLRLGRIYSYIEELVESQYKWTDVGNDDEESADVMRALYTAGMLEQRKRDGHVCSSCEIPLAMFQDEAKDEGEELTECPSPECGADFSPPVPDTPEYECPNCKATVHEGQRTCNGCGALIDFSMPAGTVAEETTVEEEVYEEDCYDAWGGYYDYTPYGYYDPYDPYVDVVAFGVCCAVLW